MSEYPHCGKMDNEPIGDKATLGTCPAPCCASCGAKITDGDWHYDENKEPVHDRCDHDGCY